MRRIGDTGEDVIILLLIIIMMLATTTSTAEVAWWSVGVHAVVSGFWIWILEI